MVLLQKYADVFHISWNALRGKTFLPLTFLKSYRPIFLQPRFVPSIRRFMFHINITRGLGYLEISMLKSMLINKDFQTWASDWLEAHGIYLVTPSSCVLINSNGPCHLPIFAFPMLVPCYPCHVTTIHLEITRNLRVADFQMSSSGLI